MADTLTLAIAQINLHVGAIDKNVAAIRAARAQATALGADLVVTPELSISGYPPEDLVLKPAFVAACEDAAAELAQDTADGGPALIIGTPWRNGDKLHNAAFLLEAGRISARRAKVELPNYGVFDEKRVFDAGAAEGPVAFHGFRLGLMICEDWWLPNVSACLAGAGAELLLSVNGSPFEDGKQERRIHLAAERVAETGLPYVFAAMVGGHHHAADRLRLDDGAPKRLRLGRAIHHHIGQHHCRGHILDMPGQAQPRPHAQRFGQAHQAGGISPAPLVGAHEDAQHLLVAHLGQRLDEQFLPFPAGQPPRQQHRGLPGIGPPSPGQLHRAVAQHGGGIEHRGIHPAMDHPHPLLAHAIALTDQPSHVMAHGNHPVAARHHLVIAALQPVLLAVNAVISGHERDLAPPRRVIGRPGRGAGMSVDQIHLVFLDHLFQPPDIAPDAERVFGGERQPHELGPGPRGQRGQRPGGGGDQRAMPAQMHSRRAFYRHTLRPAHAKLRQHLENRQPSSIHERAISDSGVNDNAKTQPRAGDRSGL